MRPRKLVLSAFGPYANEEVIDFDLLNGKNIFLITGATGSGKTTIFDAISYALFGEASGSTRENDALRSDFADIHRLTFVELDFELRGESYHIKRIPQQLKPKVKGEGFTNQGSEAELILPDGKVRTGTNNVNNKINELLGINKEQFKQIVMLPQGEFKKLLLADSKEREGIFRKIFGTYTYERIQSILNEKALELANELKKSKQSVLVNVKNIKSDEPIIVGDYIEFNTLIEKIEALITNSQSQGRALGDELKKVKEELEKLQEARIQGERNNKLLDEEKNIKIKLEELIKGQEDIANKKSVLEKINKAKEIIYIEEELDKQIRNERSKVEIRVESEKSITSLKSLLEESKKQLQLIEEKEDEKKKLTDKIASLNDKKPKIQEYDIKVNNINILNKKVTENKNIFNKENKMIESLKEEGKRIEESIKSIGELEKKKIVIENDIAYKNKLIEEVRNLYKAISSLIKNEKVHKELSIEFEKKDRIYKNFKHDYESKQESYLREQAGILAMTLDEGKPCPVCGSLEHPTPANRLGNVPTEEEVNASKKKYEEAENIQRAGLLELTKVKTEIDSLMNNVITKKLQFLSESIDCGDEYSVETETKVLTAGKELGSCIKKLESELHDLNNEIAKKDKLLIRLEQVEKEIKYKEELVVKLTDEYTDMFGKLKAEEEVINVLEKEIPENIRSLDELLKEVRALEEEVEEYNRKLKIATDKVNKVSNELSSEEAKLTEVKKIIVEINKDISDKKESIGVKIKEYSFKDYEEYCSIKEVLYKEQEIKNEIDKYKEMLVSLKDRKNQLEEKTKEISYCDIEKITNDIKEMKQEEEKLNKEYRDVYSITSNNSNILKEIKEIKIKFEDKEEEYKVIGELASLANGKKSPYISFERFVLASYFQEIIDAANIRLSKMTGERFILKRKEDKGKGTAQQGLELEVYDNYTGKCRHVKTLSGGESFKASLALALGLSDVVQANAGGISLDTIFIDEGFGTLDSESLENSISALLELQKGGRLVGIISHVSELKERIEAKLEITTSAKGSSAKFNVI